MIARRCPEKTTLYQVVQEKLATVFAYVEAQTGSGLPEFVQDEFDAFLECEIMACDFARMHCGECLNVEEHSIKIV